MSELLQFVQKSHNYQSLLTLIRCLTTVQASLVNRGNHGCRVLVHDVAAEFNRFVVKGMKDLEASAATDSPSSELSAVTRDSLDSLDSESEDESDSDEEEEEEEHECDACHSRHVVCRTHSNLKA
ncbi:unnamed protein product [Phytophthora lilii]|uniref:Unnamed protein product n=1 Tax=Phytophthora lilii TaxID=2077276 RepID=A0A9W6X238_9STRA|nr:unnamed protein product [Phytophthora lilii]